MRPLKLEHFVFHYSVNEYDVLKSKNKQNNLPLSQQTKLSAEKVNYNQSNWDYNDNISFFIEPIPTDIIGNIYGDDHPVWFNGNTLYEYRVSTRYLFPGNYSLVESKEVSELLIKHYENKISFDDYLKQEINIVKENQYMSSSFTQLAIIIEKYLGTTKETFKLQPNMPWWEDSRLKYAAGVPHLMVYPSLGEIAYKSKRKIIIGK